MLLIPHFCVYSAFEQLLCYVGMKSLFFRFQLFFRRVCGLRDGTCYLSRFVPSLSLLPEQLLQIYFVALSCFLLQRPKIDKLNK